MVKITSLLVLPKSSQNSYLPSLAEVQDQSSGSLPQEPILALQVAQHQTGFSERNHGLSDLSAKPCSPATAAHAESRLFATVSPGALHSSSQTLAVKCSWIKSLITSRVSFYFLALLSCQSRACGAVQGRKGARHNSATTPHWSPVTGAHAQSGQISRREN